MTQKMLVLIIKMILLAQFHQYCAGRLTGFEGLGLGPRSPQPPPDRAAPPAGVLAAGTQTFQLHVADPPEAIAAQLLETRPQRVENRFHVQNFSRTRCG